MASETSANYGIHPYAWATKPSVHLWNLKKKRQRRNLSCNSRSGRASTRESTRESTWESTRFWPKPGNCIPDSSRFRLSKVWLMTLWTCCKRVPFSKQFMHGRAPVTKFIHLVPCRSLQALQRWVAHHGFTGLSCSTIAKTWAQRRTVGWHLNVSKRYAFLKTNENAKGTSIIWAILTWSWESLG